MAGDRGERGFSLVEVLIASGITLAVVGAAATLADRTQRIHEYEIDDASAHQEARVFLDWLLRAITMAGTNPYAASPSACSGGARLVAVTPDPNGDGRHDDIRIQADVNPPNGLLVGLSGLCTESGEDVIVAHDRAEATVTVRDAASGVRFPLTDRVVTELDFSYLRADRSRSIEPDTIRSVRIRVRVRSRARNAFTGTHAVFTHEAEVRLRRRP